MKEHLKNILEEVEGFFEQSPTANQKAWGLIHEFYHLVLTHMEKHQIKKATLAAKLNKSRSAISQMFNKTPNITIKKMVEIADAIGLDIDIIPSALKKEIGKSITQYVVIKVRDEDYFMKKIEEPLMIGIQKGKEYNPVSCSVLKHQADIGSYYKWPH